MGADILDFELDIPRGKAGMVTARIRRAIEEAESVCGVQSGIVLKDRERITSDINLAYDAIFIPPEVIQYMMQVGSLFVTTFVTTYAATIATELGEDAATVIRDAEKSFIKWLKNRTGLLNAP